jgi:signal recognition particle subunit SRP54
MGDVLGLIEKAQQSFDHKEAEKLQKSILEDAFTFDDLKDHLKKIKGMGSLENILSMIPGVGNRIKDVNVDEREIVRIEAIISSMTKKERRNHAIIDGSRRRRIANGSGTTVADVNRLIKQYMEMKKMLKMFKGKKGFRLPKIFPF